LPKVGDGKNLQFTGLLQKGSAQVRSGPVIHKKVPETNHNEE